MGRTVYVDLIARVQGFVGPVATSAAAVRELDKSLVQLATTHQDSFNKIVNKSALFGAALTGGFLYVAKAAAEFDHEMSAVSSVMDKSGLSAKQAADQLGQLRQAALIAGKDTVFSATEAAQAEEELTKAGLSAKDILAGGLTGALSLASAGSIDLASAATDTAQALNIFGLQGSSASHVADVLTAAANTSATDVSQMAYSLNQAGLVAHQTGLSLEETAGVLADFAQQGLVGSDAGTSFKVMLQQLQAPSGKTADLMKSLGINAYDAAGNFVGIANLAQNLHDKLGPLTQAQRDYALAQIFGNDAVRSADILYEQGAAGVNRWITGVQQQGIAADTAATKLDNLQGDLEQLRGSFETLAISAGSGANAGLRLLTQGLTGVVNSLLELPPPISETITILTGLGGVTTLAATGFVKAKGGAADFMKSLRDMGPTGEKAAEGLGKVGGWLGKAGLWGAAALTLYEGVSALFSVIKSNSAPVTRDVDKLTDSLADFATTGKVTGELAKVAGDNINGMADRLAKAVGQMTLLQNSSLIIQANIGKLPPGANPQQGVIDYQKAQQQAAGQLSQVLSDAKATDAALAQLVQNGQAHAALVAYQALYQSFVAQGYTSAQIDSLFTQYDAAAGNAATANDLLTSSTNRVVTAQGTMIISMTEALKKGVALKDVIESLSGANEGYEKSNIAAKQALADLAASLAQNDKAHLANRKSLDDETQAGRDNLNNILSVIDAGKQRFQDLVAQESATKGQTAALQDASAQYDDYIKHLRTALINEGFNADAVDKLLGLYAAIPPVASTTIVTPGLADANTKISEYKTTLDKLDGRFVTTYIRTDTLTGQTANIVHPGRGFNRWGGLYTHAADGALRQASLSSAAVTGARYAYAEPGTGGELFVPRFGDYARSIGLLSVGAAWYGQMLVPAWQGGRTMGGDGAALHNHYTTNVYPQRADFGVADLEQLDRVREVRQRIGRPG